MGAAGWSDSMGGVYRSHTAGNGSPSPELSPASNESHTTSHGGDGNGSPDGLPTHGQERQFPQMSGHQQMETHNFLADTLHQRHLFRPTPFHLRQPGLQDMIPLPFMLLLSQRPLISPQPHLYRHTPPSMWTPRPPWSRMSHSQHVEHSLSQEPIPLHSTLVTQSQLRGLTRTTESGRRCRTQSVSSHVFNRCTWDDTSITEQQQSLPETGRQLVSTPPHRESSPQSSKEGDRGEPFGHATKNGGQVHRWFEDVL